MKVFSLVYNSFLEPEKVYMFSGIFDTVHQAYITSMEELKIKHPNIILKPLMVNELEIPELKSTTEIDEYRQTKNWVLKTIIDNKDEGLFKSASTYLTDQEKKLIVDKAGFISEGTK